MTVKRLSCKSEHKGNFVSFKKAIGLYFPFFDLVCQTMSKIQF
jgi:hypothetical protein